MQPKFVDQRLWRKTFEPLTQKPVIRWLVNQAANSWLEDLNIDPPDNWKGPHEEFWIVSKTDYWCSRRRPSKTSMRRFRVMMACQYLSSVSYGLLAMAYPDAEIRVMSCDESNHAVAVAYGNKRPIAMDFLLEKHEFTETWPKMKLSKELTRWAKEDLEDCPH